MGLGQGWSADTNGGWRNQFRRMDRWKERAVPLSSERSGKATGDAVDFALAYFIWAHSLRDWLIEDQAVKKEQLDDLLGKSKAWKICRDMANRSRHFNLKQNPTDKDWSLLRSYDPFSEVFDGVGISYWEIYFGDEKLRLGEVILQVHNMWLDVLEKLHLNPFEIKAPTIQKP